MSAGLVARWRSCVAVTALAVATALGAGDASAQQPQPQPKRAEANAQQPPKKPDANPQPKSQNQGPPNALQGFSQNRDEPVKIRAASLELREKDKMATFTGDVYVLQGDTEMRCKVLVVFYEQEDSPRPESGPRPVKAADPGPNGDRQIKRIEAKGNVVVVQKDQNAAGDAATFNMRENTVTLVGNVIVTRGADVLRGQRLVVDLTSGVSKMDQGRVEGLFQSGPRNPPPDPMKASDGSKPDGQKATTEGQKATPEAPRAAPEALRLVPERR